MARRKTQLAISEATVVVGWTHWSTPSGIRLNIQTTPSRTAYENGEVETRQILLTRNQALLLAQYLADVTDQTLPNRKQVSFWRRVRAALR